MRTQLRLAALAGMAVFVFSACSSPKEEEAKPVDMEKLKVEIQTMEDAFAAGEKAKDANAVAAYYAEDAVSYSRNKAPSVGKAAIKESIAKELQKIPPGRSTCIKWLIFLPMENWWWKLVPGQPPIATGPLKTMVTICLYSSNVTANMFVSGI